MPSPCLIESDHLTRPDGVERKECCWHQTLQVRGTIGGSAQNADRNPPSVEILLVWDFLVSGDPDLEINSLSGSAQVTVLQARSLRVGRCLAVVFNEQEPQLLVHAFI